MSHKKAKLLRRLVRDGADDVVVSDNVRAEKTISLSEVMDIFEPELEDLSADLMTELIKTKGIEADRLEEMRQMGLKYNRKRNSFMSGEATRF
jgi:hypothetical protein